MPTTVKINHCKISCCNSRFGLGFGWFFYFISRYLQVSPLHPGQAGPLKKLLRKVQMFKFSCPETLRSQPLWVKQLLFKTPLQAVVGCYSNIYKMMRLILSYHKMYIFQDHQYALDPVKVKRKLTEAQEKVVELQRELRNAKDRERRHKKTVKSLLKDLKHKNMLQQELDLYSGWLNWNNYFFKHYFRNPQNWV